MSSARHLALAVSALAVVTAGCSSSAGSPAGPASGATTSTPPPTSSTTSGLSCPPPGVAASWPKDAPAGIPAPAGLKITSIQRTPNVVIAFTVAQDFHATVRYFLEALPAAGFGLGTGDSEAEEADIPFSRDADHASIKINDKATCLTGGLLALGTD